MTVAPAIVPTTTPSTTEVASPPTTTTAATAPTDTQPPAQTTMPAATETGRPAARSGAIKIEYGRWKGMFELTDASLVPSLQASTVGGAFTYLGGAGCPVRNVVVEGRFYDREHVPVGLANWESSWVTGVNYLAEDRPVQFGAYGNVIHLATSAELQLVRVVCG